MALPFDKYQRLGAYHWKEFSQPTEYRSHVLYLLSIINEYKILDIGAGDGLITHILNQNGKHCTGIDSDPIAAQLAVENGQPVQCCSAHDFDYRSNSFDAILLSDSLEHIPAPEELLIRLRDATHTLYIAVPPPHEDAYAINHWSPEQLRQTVEDCGWIQTSCVEINGRITSRFIRRELLVYSANIGNYDAVFEPKYVPDGVKFVLFSDQKSDVYNSEVWEIRPHSLLMESTRISRHFKILPHEHFTYPGKSLWIDCNIQIQSNILHWSQQYEGPLWAIPHPKRTCVFQEAPEAFLRTKRDFFEIAKQCLRYENEGMPRNNGLWACGILLRADCDQVREFCNHWWSEYCQGGRRDQLSFAYSCWKHFQPLPLKDRFDSIETFLVHEHLNQT